jgi:glycyl-tRNA synthetase
MNSDVIEELAKRRGFFWQSASIHGAISGFYDYAHLGLAIKHKWENLWRSYFLKLNDNFHEIAVSQIQPEPVFHASGHLELFVDPVVKCVKCENSERADSILEDELKENFEGLTPEQLTELIQKHNIKCNKCGSQLKEVNVLNMMFPINIGTAADTKKAYLSPETAQGAYLNFKNEFIALRKKLPLGLAIIGKAFRNEISPRNSLIRMREFTQAELQIFFDPDNFVVDFPEIENYTLKINNGITCKEMVKNYPDFYVYHLAKIQQFYIDILKIPEEKFRFRELGKEERAFYNKLHFDIELKLRIGWKEVAGLHWRGDHDLSGHQKVSRESMEVSIDGKKFIPHVLEISMGVDRNIYALLDLAYDEEEKRVVLRFPKKVSPYDVAVFPLVNRDGMQEKAREVQKLLDMNVFYDETGSIGRRYRRIDEIGVPFAITIDSQTMKDNTVTIRNRDDMSQIRVNIAELPQKLKQMMENHT